MKRNDPVARRHGLQVETLEGRTLMSSVPMSPAMLEAAAQTGAFLSQPQTQSAARPSVSASPPSGPVTFDITTLLQTVKPLKHPLNGSAPMVLWGWPQPIGDVLGDYADGSLKTFIDNLAARGMVPQLPVGAGFNIQYTIAFAKTLEQEHLPVYLVFPQVDLISSTAFQNVSVTGSYTDTSGTVYTYPCIPLANPSVAAASVKQQLIPLQQAGVNVTGVIFDDEAGPDPWGVGKYESQKSSACAAYYPAGALGTFQSFVQYVYQLRSTLESQAMADPVHQLFPNAVVSNYGSFQSSASVPYVDDRGTAYPPRQLTRTDVIVPNLYNQDIALQNYSPPAQPTQRWADEVYFNVWLRTLSTAAQNRGSNQLMPFVSSNVPSFFNPSNLQYQMTDRAYQEALIHVWLRGSNTMWLFPGGGNGSMGSNAGAYEMMDDARAVYDRLLPYRNFLSQGTPMNLSAPDASGSQPVWSGLKLGQQALVRTYSPSGKSASVTVNAFDGVTVTLPAPANGATFLINAKGQVRRVNV